MKAIVFDLFRTLVDPEGVHPDAYRRTDRMASVLGLDPVELRRWWLDPDARRERNLARVPTLGERLREYCDGELNSQPPAPELFERALYEADRYHDEAILRPHEEVIETLRELRDMGIRVGGLE